MENLNILITSLSSEEIVFEVSGIDVSVANALRRILIAEVTSQRPFSSKLTPKKVPTMAIEVVEMHDNTSIIQDEVLSHRLGLIPIKADPRLFSFKAQGTSNLRSSISTVFQMTTSLAKTP